MKRDTVYLVNGLVYQGRSFKAQTLMLRDGKLTVRDAGCPTEDGTVLNAAGFRIGRPPSSPTPRNRPSGASGR